MLLLPSAIPYFSSVLWLFSSPFSRYVNVFVCAYAHSVYGVYGWLIVCMCVWAHMHMVFMLLVNCVCVCVHSFVFVWGIFSPCFVVCVEYGAFTISAKKCKMILCQQLGYWVQFWTTSFLDSSLLNHSYIYL